MPGVAYMKTRAKKYYKTVVEIMGNPETVDDQGQPTIDPTSKGFSRCKIDIFTAFSNANVVHGGGFQTEPLQSVLQLYAMFPIDDTDFELIASTTENGDYIPGGIDLEPTDTIISVLDGTVYRIRGMRGPHTSEVSRHVDLTIIGDPD